MSVKKLSLYESSYSIVETFTVEPQLLTRTEPTQYYYVMLLLYIMTQVGTQNNN